MSGGGGVPGHHPKLQDDLGFNETFLTAKFRHPPSAKKTWLAMNFTTNLTKKLACSDKSFIEFSGHSVVSISFAAIILRAWFQLRRRGLK